MDQGVAPVKQKSLFRFSCRNLSKHAVISHALKRYRSPAPVAGVPVKDGMEVQTGHLRKEVAGTKTVCATRVFDNEVASSLSELLTESASNESYIKSIHEEKRVLVKDGMEVQTGHLKNEEDMAICSTSVDLNQFDSKVASSVSVLPTGVASTIRRILEMKRDSRCGIFSMDDVSVDNYDAGFCPVATLDDAEVLKRFERFKKFDTVLDDSDHNFSANNSKMNLPSKDWVETIKREWKILQEGLPDSIFVRVYEPRMDLLRAVIIGKEGTPYHDGLFFFDVCFPSNYPLTPPLVSYHSGGLRINPNLYRCGKVCLSLPNTTGSLDKQDEMWVPGSSTILQLLVDVQSMILKPTPLLNDVIHLRKISVYREHACLLYNENTVIKSLKTMVYIMNKPPKNFEDFVVGHFRNRVCDILMACNGYMEGLQVLRLVSFVKEEVIMETSSTTFKNDLISCFKLLATAFNKIGAKEADKFLQLS